MGVPRRSNIIICFGFFVIISIIQHVRSGPNGKCAANGEYCQMHTDCCSRKCMTYSYVCAPKLYPNIYQPISNHLDDEQIAVVPLDNKRPNVEKVEYAPVPVPSQVPIWFDLIENRTCKQIAEWCTVDKECCSERCHSYLHRCVT